MEHQYERGWQLYGFGNQEFEEKPSHGSANTITGGLAFNRGVGRPHVTFSTIPANTPGQGIGMHIHRNLETGNDSEVWYIIIEGRGEMTFTNGDVVECGPGDMVVTYPGTGHSFRAIMDPVKVVSITPEMFTYDPEFERTDVYPDKFSPQIRIIDFDDGTMCVSKAICTVCGEEWNRPESDHEAATLPSWARAHQCCEEGKK